MAIDRHKPVNLVPYLAGSAISQYQAVKLTTNDATKCSPTAAAGDRPMGVALEAIASGAYGMICQGGQCKVLVDGSTNNIAPGDPLTPGATAGTLVKATSARDCIAVALDISTAAGDVISALVDPMVALGFSAGGLLATGPSATAMLRYSTVPLGSVAYGSLGTDTAPVNGTQFFSELWIDANKTLTGMALLNGSVAGTDKVIVALATDDGTVVATSALAGTTPSGTNAFQEIAFTATYAARGNARYWAILQFNGTTTRFRSIAASTFLNATGSVAGTFGTVANITPPTTTAADKGPIAYVY